MEIDLTHLVYGLIAMNAFLIIRVVQLSKQVSAVGTIAMKIADKLLVYGSASEAARGDRNAYKD
jgi:hypothetical protein